MGGESSKTSNRSGGRCCASPKRRSLRRTAASDDTRGRGSSKRYGDDFGGSGIGPISRSVSRVASIHAAGGTCRSPSNAGGAGRNSHLSLIDVPDMSESLLYEHHCKTKTNRRAAYV